MNKSLIVALFILPLLLAACGGDPQASRSTDSSPELGLEFRPPGGVAGAAATPAPSRPPVGMRPPSAQSAAGGASKDAAAPRAEGSTDLTTVGRQVITTASLTIEVSDVDAAVDAARGLTESLSGSIERLNSFGTAEGGQATLTLRVPQAQFFTALSRLERLGKVRSRDLGSQDVTDQFIDLQARLKSALAQEQSLLALLGKAVSVSDVLTIERELTRVRSEIERLQGQLNFIERRVELATVNVSFVMPPIARGEPPSGNLVLRTRDVGGAAGRVKELLAGLKGTLDFSTLTVVDGRQQAALTLRVFPQDFTGAMATLEGLGKVIRKEVNEGRPADDGSPPKAEKPNARITVAMAEPVPQPFNWWPIGLGAGIPTAVLALLAGSFLLLRRRPSPLERAS